MRDYVLGWREHTIFPYDKQTAEVWDTIPESLREHFWRLRTILRNRQDYGEKIEQRGLRWHEHSMFFPRRYLRGTSLAFPFVASHNHFVLDRGEKLFNRSAPVITLDESVDDDGYFALLAFLNSSTICFWMKQVSQQKQLTGGDGVRVESVAKVPYEYGTTQMQNLPMPEWYFEREHQASYARLGRALHDTAIEMESLSAEPDARV